MDLKTKEFFERSIGNFQIALAQDNDEITWAILSNLADCVGSYEKNARKELIKQQTRKANK